MGTETSTFPHIAREEVAPASRANRSSLGEDTNLRLLLELRRRLKAAAEKELALGQERLRSLRNELRRAEGELRVWGRSLQRRREEIAAAATRVAEAVRLAAETCRSLSSLQRENEDLTAQLQRAERAAAELELSVPRDRHAGSATLDAFVAATRALVKELSRAARDQLSVRVRTQDLLEDSRILASEGRSLSACFEAVQSAIDQMCRQIADGVDPAHSDDEIAAGGLGALSVPEQSNRPVADADTT